MKTFKNIIFTVTGMFLFLACDVNEAVQNLPEGTQLLENNTDITAMHSRVGVPFKAWFFTEGTALGEDGRCIDPALLNTQEGDGKGTHLGRFTTTITFCMDLSDVMDEDGQLTEGESLPYGEPFGHSAGTFIAANGDELYFTVSGAVVPSEDPEFDFQFMDPFEFTGGNGRFESATGGGVTNSFVTAGVGTGHEWTGTLFLLKGHSAGLGN